ncbi:hypothetical protein [Lacinutrix sp. Bg11-31]|uniref:hypothetical protein n=1 Tax=Lacinutrix sp. Bg11-31 TaxID=2057808 RepID=UPI0012FE51C0|nr:hypothetical protein [Lacinutrix sp. Bg11-31]
MLSAVEVKAGIYFNLYMKYSILILFILIFFISCKTENSKKIYIVTEDAYNKERKERLDSTYLKKYTDKQKRVYDYQYRVNDSLLSHYFHVEKEINNSKYIKIFEVVCPVVDSIVCRFNNKNIKIYKYLFDEINISDDRTDYYFVDELGIVFSQNMAWNIKYYYNPNEYESIQDFIKLNEDKFKSSFNMKQEIKN